MDIATVLSSAAKVKATEARVQIGELTLLIVHGVVRTLFGSTVGAEEFEAGIIQRLDVFAREQLRSTGKYQWQFVEKGIGTIRAEIEPTKARLLLPEVPDPRLTEQSSTTDRVADPQAAHPPKPISVHRAVICLWISAAVTVVSAVLHAGILATADVVIVAVTAGLLSLVAANVTAGRNWARWLFLAVWVLGSFTGMAVVVLAPEAFLAWPGTVQAVAILQFLLQTAALVLLFTRASKEWFGHMRASG